MAKHSIKSKKRIILITILSIIFLVSIVYLINYFLQHSKHNNELDEIQEYITQEEQVSKTSKVQELQKENSDIKAWMEIEGTDINYPVLQTTDNEYYLTHNYKKEESKNGSVYFHKEAKIEDNNSNLIIYGHNMGNGVGLFNDLLEYQKEEFYENHKTIQLITDKEEREYEIISVFLSRVFYKDETDVFRYYSYTNFENEARFEEYIKNIDKIKLYDTGLTAQYGEQLMTLITCEYSEENGRLVVVAKRVK